MVLARNKKAFHDYFIEDKLEAGIELVGTEVKSVKAGKTSIKESFIRIIKNEVFSIFPLYNSRTYLTIDLMGSKE